MKDISDAERLGDEKDHNVLKEREWIASGFGPEHDSTTL